MREQIQKIIAKVAGVKDASFDVLIPDNPTFGHYFTNAAMKLAKSENKNPREVAENLVSKIRAAAPKNFFAKVEVAGPGFINFWISPNVLQKELQKMLRPGALVKSVAVGKKRTVVVDYSAVNIAKPMHVGHLRSTIIGDTLANLHEFLGYKVVRWNYLGDWGTQFGKLIAAFKLWGDPKKVEENPIGELLALYVRFHEEIKKNPKLEAMGQKEFKKLENGDAENLRLWKWFKKESYLEFEKTYKTLGVKFDTLIGESFYEKRLKPLTAELLKKGVAQKSEGAVIINLAKDGLPPALIQKSDGASLYLTRDIANLEYRLKKFKPAKIIYVVANEQALHFEQLFAIAKMLWPSQTSPSKRTGLPELSHVKFGIVLDESGKKFSTREGKMLKLEDVLGKAFALAREIVEKKNEKLSGKEKNKIAETVGIGAIKYNDLRENRNSDIVFNWERMLDWKGDSAPYLQYTYARLVSILAKAKHERLAANVKRIGRDAIALTSETELSLIKKLVDFGDIIKTSAESLMPNHLCLYLYELANLANRFYESTPILKDADISRRQARLALIDAISENLKTGLGILGIQTLDKI